MTENELMTLAADIVCRVKETGGSVPREYKWAKAWLEVNEECVTLGAKIDAVIAERDALRREVEEQRVSLDGLHGELHKFDALRRSIDEAPVVYGQRTFKDTAWKIDWRFRAEPFHTHRARLVRIEEIPKEKT